MDAQNQPAAQKSTAVTPIPKSKRLCIVLYGKPIADYRKPPAVWSRTVLPATWRLNEPRLSSSQAGWYSVYLPQRDRRLSWLWWWLYTTDTATQFTSYCLVFLYYDWANDNLSPAGCWHFPKHNVFFLLPVSYKFRQNRLGI